VNWPDAADDRPRDGLHWKTRPLLDWAAGRAFVWVDDEMTERDRDWITAHHPGHALLYHVDPRCGLTDPDFVALDRWLQSHQG
jgi:hypothetical protein